MYVFTSFCARRGLCIPEYSQTINEDDTLGVLAATSYLPVAIEPNQQHKDDFSMDLDAANTPSDSHEDDDDPMEGLDEARTLEPESLDSPPIASTSMEAREVSSFLDHQVYVYVLTISRR